MLKKTALIILIAGFFIVGLINLRCSTEKVVAEIGPDKITLKDFEDSFLKAKFSNIELARNSGIQEKSAYLKDMIKTELKYREGIEKKLDTLPKFNEELKREENSLLSYEYIRTKLVEPNLKDYYEKIRHDIRVSHIFLPIEKDMSFEDSVKKYQLAREIINRLQSNESFESLAKIYSAESETRENGGDLYFISPGMTFPEFEYAAYNLNPGDFTKEPVRTIKGLHIIKQTDRKERYDSVKVSHILITDKVNANGAKDSLQSYKEIESLRKKISSAEDFEKIAKEYSEDTITKSKGGDLGYIKRRQFSIVFDSTIFSLEPGKISDIIRTEYGWHILIMTDAVKIKPFEDIKGILEIQFANSYNYRKLYNDFVLDLRGKYGLSVDKNGVDFILNKVKDTTLAFEVINPNILFSEEDKKIVTGRFSGGEITINDLIAYVSKNSNAAKKELTRFNLITIISASADTKFETLEAISLGYDKNVTYLKAVEKKRKEIIAGLFDAEVILKSINITDDEKMKFYLANSNNFNVPGQVNTKQKFDDVKASITDILRQGKFRSEEEIYFENLKIKYNVVINGEVLEMAFR